MWQRDNRDFTKSDDQDYPPWREGGYSAFLETKKREKQSRDPLRHKEWLAKIEANPDDDWVKWEWNEKQYDRRYQWCYQRERGCKVFSDYVEAVRRRLAQHGFTRPFQLKEDPKEQDRLTTWIEYLNYEYWWLDRFTRTAERLKTRNDDTWQKLVDSNMLEPGETREVVGSGTWVPGIHCGVDRVELAWDAVQKATSMADKVSKSTQLGPDRLSIPEPERIRMVEEAEAQVLAARQWWERQKEKVDLVKKFRRGTSAYTDEKKDGATQENRLSWVLRQIPLIEAELKAELIRIKTTDAGRDSTKSRKRRLASGEYFSETRNPKKQKRDHGGCGMLPGSSTAVLSGCKEAHQRALLATDDD